MRQVPPAQDDDAPLPLRDDKLAQLLNELGDAQASSNVPWAPFGPISTDEPRLASEHFVEALSAAQIGIIHRRIDGPIITVNDYFCELLGRSREELVGLTIIDFARPGEVVDALEAYREHAAAGTPYQMERRYVRPNGSESSCQVHVSFLRDSEGRPNASIAVVVDVTARRNAEAGLRESEAHYRNTVELAPQISWTAAPDGAILEVSPRWSDVTGCSPLSALGNGWIDSLLPEDIAPTLVAWNRCLRTGEPVDVTYRLRTEAGKYRWFRARAAPRLGTTNQIIRWYGTLEDIDDRKRAEQALRESEERFRLAAQAAGLGIWDFDAVQGRREWSDEFKAMLGLPATAEPLVPTAMSLVIPEDRHKLQKLVEAVYAGKSDYRFEALLRIRRADTGELRWIQTGGWRIDAPNGHLERVLVTIMDVTSQRSAEERIRWTANHDALTGLPNRSYFAEQLETAIARAEAAGERLALILFDVDNLKETNDTVGHGGGDKLLQVFADGLRETLGESAVLARLGGDEFAAFFTVSEEAEIASRAERALGDFTNAFEYDGVSLACQATAGAALYPRDGATADDLLKTADVALYAGKAGRKGMLSVFRPEMRANVQRRAAMLALARCAIAERRVEPFYQPKVTLADERVAGFEALLRLRDGEDGVLGPDRVSAAFEDMNLASALSEQMLDGVCRDVARWLDRGLAFGRVAINLSPAEFRRDDLFERIMGRLHRCGLPPSLFELEVTETVFMGRGAEAVGDVLRDFHKAGMRLALDDFGTGYASLTHLQAFPIDTLKIDRSFVSDLAAGSANAAIVDAIIGLAARLNIDVIAEGIEAPTEAAYLAERGCKYGQGFLFGRAMDAAAVERLLG